MMCFGRGNPKIPLPPFSSPNTHPYVHAQCHSQSHAATPKKHRQTTLKVLAGKQLVLLSLLGGFANEMLSLLEIT